MAAGRRIDPGPPGRSRRRPAAARGRSRAEALARLYEQRAPIYSELADLVFDVDRMAPPQVVDEIVAALEERGAPSDA